MKILTILFIVVLSLSRSGFCWIASNRNRRQTITYKLLSELRDSTTSLTETSYMIPRFFEGKVDDGTYPSSLHYVHVKSILSDDEVSKCLELANEYAALSGAWEQPDETRHSSYATCDFPVEDCETLSTYLNEIDFDGRIFDHLSFLYGLEYDDMSYLDFFCAHYEPVKIDKPNVMDRLEFHRDGSLLSFTITLSSPDQFEGGGTIFDALRDLQPSSDGILRKGGVVRPLRGGDAVFHCGKLLHGADVVLSGQRTVLVGFIEVADWCCRPGVLSNACRQWGRMDVAKLRLERQLKKTANMKLNGWFMKNDRWISVEDTGGPNEKSGRSHIQGFCPAFDSVLRRGQPEFQRRTRLEAEDILVRSILLENSERGHLDIFGGDMTIL